MAVTFDVSGFNAGVKKLQGSMKDASNNALFGIGGEILRLSGFEVPHDKGLLQASGSVEKDYSDQDAYIVGYNKVYAARLHEHPEYRFQKNRKGKYLEDPIKNNVEVFIRFYQNAIKGILG